MKVFSMKMNISSTPPSTSMSYLPTVRRIDTESHSKAKELAKSQTPLHEPVAAPQVAEHPDWHK